MKTSKKILSVFLSVLLAFTVCAAAGAPAFAQTAVLGTGACGKNGDDVTWTLTDDGVLTISGSGETADYLDHYFLDASTIVFENAPWEDCRDNALAARLGYDSPAEMQQAVRNGTIDAVAYAAAVKDNAKFFNRVVIEEGVTGIGGRALDVMNITSVSLPSTLKKIGEYALCGNRLTELTLPEGLEQIGTCAFVNNRLTELTIPSTVETVGNNLLWGNNGLRTLTVLCEVPIGQLPTFYGRTVFDAYEEYALCKRVRDLEPLYTGLQNDMYDMENAVLSFMWNNHGTEENARNYVNCVYAPKLQKVRDALGMPADATAQQMLTSMWDEINAALGTDFSAEEMFDYQGDFFPSYDYYTDLFALEDEALTDELHDLTVGVYGVMRMVLDNPALVMQTEDITAEEMDEEIALLLRQIEETYGISAATPREVTEQILARVNDAFGKTAENAYTDETIGKLFWASKYFSKATKDALRSRFGFADDEEAFPDLYWTGQIGAEDPDYYPVPWFTVRMACGNPNADALAQSGFGYELIHTPQAVAETAATATEHGFTAGVQCADCGAWLSGHEIVHNTLGERTELAELTENGERQAIIVCTVCGESGLYAFEKTPSDEAPENPDDGNAGPFARMRKAIKSFVDWVLRLIKWLGMLGA